MTRTRSQELLIAVVLIAVLAPGAGFADDGRAADSRARPLRDLNSYFPMQAVGSAAQWPQRQQQIRRRILVSQGLWPLPTRSPLRAVIHGRVERDDYVVDRVFFESAPGHYVTGSLYRPKQAPQPMPAILSPHGHWQDGRFYDAGEAAVAKEIASGGESSAVGGRHPIQARAVGLARMGCLVLVYDMTGYADSIQLGHRPDNWQHLDRRQEWGFMSVQADLRLQNMMGLQTWNSIRAIDFLMSLPETDPHRIGVTGASGGGTQAMILSAIDDRIAAAMPCVMVSTAMQGGCSCENAPLLRIDQGNIDIAAATAPRPLGLTAADDWTIQLQTKGYPDLVKLYEMLGHRDRLSAVFHTRFKHNYNQVNRLAMYSFFNRHFDLGLAEPIGEREYQPLSIDEATVWSGQHAKPTGDQVGDAHEVQLLAQATAATRRQLDRLIPDSPTDLNAFRHVIGGAWQTILGRQLAAIDRVSFQESSRQSADSVTIRRGDVEYATAQERVSVALAAPPGASLGNVLLITEPGTRSVQASEYLKTYLDLVGEGFTVIAADLFGPAPPISGGQQQPSQRMLSADNGHSWKDFCGYTYGYNPSLFARRVHDVLTLIAYARTDRMPTHLIGIGAVAGPVAAAAGSLADDAITSLIVDTQGFQFAEIDRHDHPMFVPGASKYFGVDGLIALNAPRPTMVTGTGMLEVTRAAYRASEHQRQLHEVTAIPGPQAIGQWFKRAQ